MFSEHKDGQTSRLRIFMNSILLPGCANAYTAAYRICYLTGALTMRAFRRFAFCLCRFLSPVGKALDFLLLRRLRAVWREIKKIGTGFPLAARRLRAAASRHPLLVIPQALALPVLAFRRHRKAAVTLLNIAAPAAAAVMLCLTVQHWSNTRFALALEYGGEQMGYISDEAVFANAATMATARVINTDNSFQIDRKPTLTIAMAPKDALLNETTICDRLLRSSSDSISQASGLYVDGKFEGALVSRGELDGLLAGILDSYREKSDDQAEFVQEVKILDGLYPVTAVVDQKQMLAYLTSSTIAEKQVTVQKGDSVSRIAARNEMTISELQTLNPGLSESVTIGQTLLVQRAQPYLRVQVRRTIEYTETIAFATKKVEDPKQYMGYEAVRAQGKDGVRKITAEIVLLDGSEQSREILSSTVTQQPVDKIVVVGAKKYNPDAKIGDGIATGKFLWPVPSCASVYGSYGYRGRKLHKGIDISGQGINGQPIIASDGGTVIAVNTSGWGGGYGLYVLIDHGDGYVTRYAHCSQILVQKGQKVTQGQMIARVGNTGDSRAPHCHFEILVNGAAKNPMSFVSPKNK